MRKRIVFTGGGSAGHVTVNLALMPHFLREGWKVAYIGSEAGIERELVTRIEGVRYFGIATGKWRRYFDWKNASDPLRVLKGVWQAHRLLRSIRPDVVFSKGGFVSVPVVLASRLHNVPVVLHESDLTPGLANRIAIPFARTVCTTFPDTLSHIPDGKGEHVGAVVREELKRGTRERGYALTGFVPGRPVLLVMGGSLGSQRINRAIRDNAEALLERFQIVHICGKGQVDAALHLPGYRQYEYVQEEQADLLAIADLVVSRAGSNAIFEFLALRKPMLLIPLSQAASRGDQVQNARSFERQGFCEVLEEEGWSDSAFLAAVQRVADKRGEFSRRMEQAELGDPLSRLLGVIKATAGR